LKKSTFWITTILICISLLSIVSLLPHDPYLRYQSLNIGTYNKAKWLYERSVFDSTPIDIAFIGTSHTLNAVDSVIIEKNINTSSNSFRHVANFSIPHFGRDMHKLIAKLLIENKLPAIIVIEIRESEERDQHPATHYLAESYDLLKAPLLINKRYFGNLIRLPLRQSSLFMQTYFPSIFGKTLNFNPNMYLGSHLNFTTEFPGERLRNNLRTKEQLEESMVKWNKLNEFKLNRENSTLNFLYFNANWSNLLSTVELAKSKGVKVYFNYLPNYGSKNKPIDYLIYEQIAPILYPKDFTIFKNPEHWSDLGHLNGDGATAYSNDISALLNEILIK
jgi:hypothetical protein